MFLLPECIYVFHMILKLTKNEIIYRENQFDAQFIFSIFRQTSLSVSGVSIAHHQEVQPYVYNNLYLLFFLDDCLLSWLDMFRAYL